jgi:hypothetical protein
VLNHGIALVAGLSASFVLKVPTFLLATLPDSGKNAGKQEVGVGFAPPTEVAVKAFGAIDVRNRDDDDLELHVDRPGSRRLNGSFAVHVGTAHVWLLAFEVPSEWQHTSGRVNHRRGTQSNRLRYWVMQSRGAGATSTKLSIESGSSGA